MMRDIWGIKPIEMIWFFFVCPAQVEDNATLIALSTCQMSLKNLARDLPQHVLRNLWCENCMQRQKAIIISRVGKADWLTLVGCAQIRHNGFESFSKRNTHTHSIYIALRTQTSWLKHATTIKIHTGENAKFSVNNVKMCGTTALMSQQFINHDKYHSNTLSALAFTLFSRSAVLFCLN